ncbi:T9SS type A sorting domain-containing protein [Xanthomarina sp. F2636L]|uniref:T9SS type A sorting domain-containing protein n=1 Tax=Xanthomarina sp. F2636L TaxID=2996018 RepID=UPI00225E5D13|nr:T9SS type A sorting domain-containing protein [Xanthomarina sp. F2636L]MCX7551006.1 T9SS type A sorting domain-containing protein [Xanthomarina sp. F2636L]
MKKTTFLIALFFACYSLTYAQYTSVPDAIFEQALIDANIDSNPTIDGQVLTIEANNFTGSISMTGLGILDLTGVEALINMTGITFNYNPGITSVDLSSCTSLTSVSALGCGGLASINVTGLTNLTDLNLRSTALTSLDVTTNIALENLNVRKCNLSSLDLSQNTALISVDAKTNNLTFMDMRNGNNANVTAFNADSNPNLECLFVDDSAEPNLLTWIKDANTNYVETIAECNTISIDSVNDIAFNMYPNPAFNSLYITTKTNSAVVSIYNITGKVILTKTLSKGENVVNVSGLASGIYLARFVSDSKVDTKKLIIK